MNKVTPIGGRHRSAISLLAEVMNDPDMDRCIVLTFRRGGDIGWGHYEVTQAETTYAAALLNRLAFDEEG